MNRKSNKIKLKCQGCGKEFKVFPSNKKAKYCSHKCSSPHTGFQKSHPFYGDLTKSNYFQKGQLSTNLGRRYKIKDTSKYNGKVTSQQGFQKGNHPKTEWGKREKCPSWKGGISFEPYSIDWTDDLKRAIRKRDKYTCQICREEPAICVHHIDYDKKNCNPNNLIPLCRNCHPKTNHNRNYWIKYFNLILWQEKQVPSQAVIKAQ